MSRRESILAEMGLAPLWRLRSAPAQTPAAPAANDALVADDRVARVALMDWTELQSAVSACTACGLCRSRTNTVFGVGDRQANLLIVGEAPGQEEDARGEPFVGAAGRLLDNMLAAIDLRRGENVYIANVLKCRPPGNRNPAPEEIEACGIHLKRQIELIQPKLILAMGRFAAQTLLNSGASIASLRGRTHEYSAVPTIVTYHPAYLLRTPADKAKAWEDLCFARASLLKSAAARAAN
jgi:uracil-DNA glycosylase